MQYSIYVFIPNEKKKLQMSQEFLQSYILYRDGFIDNSGVYWSNLSCNILLLAFFILPNHMSYMYVTVKIKIF